MKYLRRQAPMIIGVIDIHHMILDVAGVGRDMHLLVFVMLVIVSGPAKLAVDLHQGSDGHVRTLF